MVDEDHFIDDARYDEMDEDYDDDVVEYEYVISPDRSSLDLIKNVQDFTDRKKIYSSMFMAVPKNRYRSNFIPRKFAVIPKELDNLTTLSQSSQASENTSYTPNSSSKTDRLSSASKARHVPSTRVGRLANFSSLGIGLGLGTLAEASKRVVGLGSDSGPKSSVVLSEVSDMRVVIHIYMVNREVVILVDVPARNSNKLEASFTFSF